MRYPRHRIIFAAVIALACAGCGRTGPWFLDPEPGHAPDAGRAVDAGPDAPDVPDPDPISCEPSEEVCNGSDDDCDGAVDELPPEPCELGGSRYCIAGRMSECPRRCEHCVPGSERVCFLNYCTFWGIQTCSADGRSFGPCRELRAPPECITIARNERDSPELEQCCIDNGYCCLDRHDLDADGDRSESLGECEEVLCDP